MPNTTPTNTTPPTTSKAAFKALVPTSNSDNNHPVSVLNDISQNRNGPMAMRAPALLLVTATLSCFDIGARAQQDCVQGADCGGQVWTDCGSSCPLICGQPPADMCMAMCQSEYQCSAGTCFNDRTGTCVNDEGAAPSDPAPPPEEPAEPVELWCTDSPEQTCRMVCEDVAPCPDGQCNMRSGSCCDSSCVAATTVTSPPLECTGCCPEGAACFAPDPECCVERAPVESPPEETTPCRAESDCGETIDPGCGYSCLDGECAMWCESEPMFESTMASGDTSSSSDDEQTARTTTVASEEEGEEEAVVVRATLSLDGELDAVAGVEGSAARADFVAAFSADIAATLGLADASRVVIASIVAGSVVVTFDVMPDETEGSVEISIAVVEAAFAEAGVSLPTVGVTTAGPATGVSATTVAEEEAGNVSPGPQVVMPVSGASRVGPAAGAAAAAAAISGAGLAAAAWL